MAITTMDGLIAAMQPFGEDVVKAAFTGEAAGQYHSSFYLAGRPGAAVAPTPGLNGTHLTSYAGQIPIPAAVGGTNIHLARLEFSHAGNIGGVTVMDRLWHNSSIAITTTGAQAITFGTPVSRDNNGAALGAGVMAALEVSTATTNGSAITNTTISYTNSAGTAGRTGTISSFPATAVAGTFVPFNLAAGDTGIRSIESITLGTSYVSGTIHLVTYREAASIGAPVANTTVSAGPIELGLPRLYDNGVLFLVYTLVGTAAGISNAQLTFAQG